MAAAFQRVSAIRGDKLSAALSVLRAEVAAVMLAPVDEDALGLGYRLDPSGQNRVELTDVTMSDRSGVVERRIRADVLVQCLRMDAVDLDADLADVAIPAVQAALVHGLLALVAADIPALRDLDCRAEPAGAIRFYRSGNTGREVVAETRFTLALTLPVAALIGDPDA